MADVERRALFNGEHGIEDWRNLVRKALNGGDPSELRSRTLDRIVIEPLYTRRLDTRSIPGRLARPWSLVQIVDDPDPDAANEQAIADIEGGATGLSLRLAGAPSAAASGVEPSAEALRIALEDIDLLAIHLRLEPHADAISIARWLVDIVESSGTAPELTHIAFGLDPVATIVGGGSASHREYGACVGELTDAHFRGPFAALDGRIYHEAGATEAQEVAGILASAAWWLRALDEVGISPVESIPFLGASLAVNQEHLVSLAKVRALRLAWARLQELCGAPIEPLLIHADTSRRMLTRADPTTNLLRTTLAAFAAGVGGADSVTVLPHTAALGHPDGDARALARNIRHLLIEEAHLHRVEDPAAGSGAIEALTEALAERAWTEFRAIEEDGGVVASLSAGAFQARIAEARDALEAEGIAGRLPLVGATVYPAPSEGTECTPLPPASHLRELGLAPIRLEEMAKAGGS